MIAETHVWRQQQRHFECCHHCVAPKRHPGCHSACKEYAEGKETYEYAKKFLRENSPPILTEYDFNKDNPAAAKKKRR